MMKTMRENTKIILWVVVVAFVITIFAVWGLDLQTGGVTQNQNLIGRVNGVPVSPQTYQSIYSQMVQQFRANSQTGELTAIQQEMLRDQAWESIVSNIITGEQIEKLGIGVTDDEVLTYIRNSPPPEIQDYFRDDKGQFDYAAYQAALANPDADWTAVERLVRQRIPLVKLNQVLVAQVFVSNLEIRDAFAEETVKILARYVAFPIESEELGGWQPSEDEIAAYYESHKDDYREPEKAALQVARIPRQPSDADRDDLLYTARHIRDQAAGGEDFAALARTYSEAHTATVGGETGFLGSSQRDAALMTAVASLKPGEMTEPVATPDGVYLVQLIDTRKEKGETQYNMREIFLKLSAGSATVDSLSALAQDVQRAAAGTGDLAAAANARGLEVTSTQPFAEGMPIAGIGFAPALSRFAFSASAGAVSNVIYDDAAIYVCRLESRTPPAVRALDEVTDSIRQSLMHQARVDAAMLKAGAFRRSAAPPDVSFDDVAKQYNLTVAKTDSFTVAQGAAGQPPYSSFGRSALAVRPGEVTRPFQSGNTVFVVKVDALVSPSDEEFQERAPAIRDRLYQQRIQEYVAYWYEDIREKSKIEDYREIM